MTNNHQEHQNSEELNESQQEELSGKAVEDALNPETVTEENTSVEVEGKEKKKKGLFSKKKDSETEILSKQLEEAILAKSEMHDRYLRLYSEFDNYRKRTNKDKLELIKNASEEMIKSLLPVVDDFERAIKIASNSESDAITEGVLLIYSKLMTLLKQKGVSAIESIGKPFDTDFHEAITNVPASHESEKGLVIDEVEKGYLLNDKIIRYAKVVVAN